MARERRITPPAVSPREAAFATGLSEKTIQQAIDREEVGTLRSGRRGDEGRLIGFSDLVYLSLRRGVGRLLSAEGKRKLRSGLGSGEPPPVVGIGPLKVRVSAEARALREKLDALRHARSQVVSDPDVRAGEPVVRGTRIAVHPLEHLARQGATEEELLEDHPALTPESLRAALLYARTYPRRGRPRRPPWGSGGTVVRGGKGEDEPPAR